MGNKGGSVSPQNRGRRAAAPPAGAWGDLPAGRGSERAPPRHRLGCVPHGRAAEPRTPPFPTGRRGGCGETLPFLTGRRCCSEAQRRATAAEGGRERGKEKRRLLPTPTLRTRHQSAAPLWQLAQGGFARLQKCLWKAPDAEADGRGGLRIFWVLPRRATVCTSG